MPSFLDKFKQTKGTLFLTVGLLCGLLLIVIGSRGESVKNESAAESHKMTTQKTDDAIAVLERRVSQLLNAMDGVSEATVILTPDTTEQTVYAANDCYESGALAKREYLLAESDGDGEPILLTLIYPKLRGVAVVCRGGSNPILQEKIINLLCALFDLSSTDVYVTG